MGSDAIVGTDGTPLEVRLFGGFEARWGGELLDLHHRRADYLLALLSLAGNWADREWLLTRLDVTPDSLDQTVSALKKGLRGAADRLEVRNGRVRVALSEDECDLARFDRHIGAADEERLRKAVLAYSGPLLGHWERRDGSALDACFASERSRRETRLQEGIEQLIRLLTAEDRAADALPFSRRYAEAFPLSERAWTLYLRTAGRAGDRLEAVAAHDRYRDLLAARQMVPSAAIERLYQQILNEEGSGGEATPTPPITPPRGAMHPADERYVPRTADTEVRAALMRGSNLFVVLKGTRGVGKSSLALRALEDARRVGALTLRTDLKAFPVTVFDDTESLCRALAVQIAGQLPPVSSGMTAPPPESPTLSDRDDDAIRKLQTVGFEHFFQRYVLQGRREGRVVWVLDGVDRLFGTTGGHDLFSNLRSWNDKSNYPSHRLWRRVRVLLISATEPAQFLQNIEQSPFNVATAVDLSDFTREQVRQQAERAGVPLTPKETDFLYDLLGGHPLLTGQALERRRTDGTMDSLAAPDGPETLFAGHLHRLRERIVGDDLLRAGVRLLLRGKPLPAESRRRLACAGVLGAGEADSLRCRLYRTYLAHTFRDGEA